MVSWLELVGVDKTADAAILFALSNEKSLRKALTMNAPDKCVGMRVRFTYTIKKSPYVCICMFLDRLAHIRLMSYKEMRNGDKNSGEPWSTLCCF